MFVITGHWREWALLTISKTVVLATFTLTICYKDNKIWKWRIQTVKCHFTEKNISWPPLCFLPDERDESIPGGWQANHWWMVIHSGHFKELTRSSGGHATAWYNQDQLYTITALFGSLTPLSNFHTAKFSLHWGEYHSSEEFLHHKKSILFKDEKSATLIMAGCIAAGCNPNLGCIALLQGVTQT